MLKSYIPGINSLIYSNRHYDNLFYGKLVNELYDWTEKHPNAIQSTHVSDSLSVKIDGNMVNK